jgi:hypothetical protein
MARSRESVYWLREVLRNFSTKPHNLILYQNNINHGETVIWKKITPNPNVSKIQDTNKENNKTTFHSHSCYNYLKFEM